MRAYATEPSDPAGTLERVVPRSVAVWNVDLDQPVAVVDVLRGYLDDAETHAAAARRDDLVRNRYVVAHGALRSILAARLGIAPGAVELTRHCARCGDPAHGKPALGNAAGSGADRLEFSLSHSESIALIAVTTGARVGVDIEVERPRARLDALAARVLGPEDHADWLDLEPSARLHAFLEQWTAKEAYLKAIGAGVTVTLRDVPVEPEGWMVTGVRSPPQTVARVAVEGSEPTELQVNSWMPPAVASQAPRDANRPIDKFRGTAVGSVLAAGLLGLRDALETPKDDKVAIVKEYAGDPPFTDPIVLRLDPDHPEDSIVMVRPWLRDPKTPPQDEPA